MRFSYKDLRTVEEFFYARISREPSGCWHWMGRTTTAGYGVASCAKFGVFNEYAHRLSYRLFKGPIPSELLVRHTCDNPRCCNPEHLVLGDDKANQQDKVIRGRSTRANAKLTETQVLEIYRNREESAIHLATCYGVSKQTVLFIWQGRLWSGVTGHTKPVSSQERMR